jgi:cytochrome c-type biogenesis protein CcmH/NrfF
LVLVGLFVLPVPAETPDQQRARVERIEAALLAPCCYREQLSRHQSEIAVKMRLEIAKWVEAGKTDQEILDAYVKQYGSKVLVDPGTAPRWWMRWAPWLVLAIGAVICVWLVRRWHSRTGGGQPVAVGN